MGKKRPRLSNALATAGKELAVKLQAEGRLSYDLKKRRIREEVGCSDSAAERWLAAAKDKAAADDADISPEELEGSRRRRLYLYDARTRLFRKMAERRLKDGDPGQAVKCESVAIRYEHLMAQVAHWDRLSPEQDLDDPALRRQVLAILTGKMAAFSTTELLDMVRAVTAELAERQRGVELPPLDLRALGALAAKERQAGQATQGENLASKI
jgi:hypothetical protein